MLPLTTICANTAKAAFYRSKQLGVDLRLKAVEGEGWSGGDST